MTTLEEAKLKTLIAYTGYDPFAQSLPIDQLDASTENKARSNPSKQLQTIRREMEKSGGWLEVGKDLWSYTVLSGPYTGRYQFRTGRARFEYYPDIKPPYWDVLAAPGIERLRAQRLGDLLKLSTVVNALSQKHKIGRKRTLGSSILYRILRTEAEKAGGKRARARTLLPRPLTGKGSAKQAWISLGEHQQYRFLARHYRYLIGRRRPQERNFLDRTEFKDALVAWKADLMKAWWKKSGEKNRVRGKSNIPPPEFIEYWAEMRQKAQQRMPEAQRLALLYEQEDAQILYVLSRAANVSVDQVIAAIRENPKRLLSVPQEQAIPTRMNDRVRYAREFLRTWSMNRALRVLFPNIDGKIDKLFPLKERVPLRREPDRERSYPQRASMMGHFVEPVRWALNFVPSPSQLNIEGQSLALAVQEFRKAGGKKSDWQELVARLRRRPEDFESLLDRLRLTMNIIPEIRRSLAQNLRGRKILEAAESPGPAWIHLLREQAYIDHLNGLRLEEESELTVKEMVLWHAKGAELLKLLYGTTTPVFPSGASIRALQTQEDFKKEGREMHHCVSGHFWLDTSWVFAFRDSRGRKATLEWTPDLWPARDRGIMGHVSQFFGPKVVATSQGLVCASCREPVYEQATPPKGEEPRTCGNVKPAPGSELDLLRGDFLERVAGQWMAFLA